jgi:hypothetical protein
MMTRSQTNNNAYNASSEAYNAPSSEASPVGVRRSPRFSEPLLRRSPRLNPKVDSHQKEDSHLSVPVHLVSSIQGKHLEPRRSSRLNPSVVEPSVKMTIEEQEDDDGVFIRRSKRLVSQPKCYVDPDDYFDLDNDSDDEDYNPKYDMAHNDSDKRVRPRSIPFDVDEDIKFDFDEASRAWRQNKHSIGNGMFAYRTRSRSSSK